MGEGRQSIIEHKGFSVQRKANMEADGEIYWAICNRGDSINECSKIVTTKLNKNTSGSQCKPDSTIQGTSRRAKERGGKTSRSRRN